ncbi:hypothetical protein K2173_008207 [Erythroxylum novogranatense]|uniref:Uncharacterized protein n=1 Tax=Erythroxylum novogranatense TaxID=1862640 RepID=A0AAV8UCP9_9ROSI|nr:hypothetical protein K2173_008207 [Erythroxylum novogranatense]
MLTRRSFASPPPFVVLPFYCDCGATYQSRHLNFGLSRGTRKLEVSSLKAGFWDSLRSG